jgi:hypothetical protein
VITPAWNFPADGQDPDDELHCAAITSGRTPGEHACWCTNVRRCCFDLSRVADNRKAALRTLLHCITHRHVHLTKANVVDIVLCARRWPARTDLIVVTALPQPGQGPWHLADVTLEVAEAVFAHDTAAGMLGTLTELGGRRWAGTPCVALLRSSSALAATR